MSSPSPSFITPAEYLDLERKAETRSEYLAGRIFAKSASNRWHNLIVGNLVAEISTQLRGKPCEAYAITMRVKVSDRVYTYPDIVAVCGEPRFEDTYIDTLLNPTVIIEVLSESTEAYDRGEKFAHYRRLDTLRSTLSSPRTRFASNGTCVKEITGLCTRSAIRTVRFSSRPSTAR